MKIKIDILREYLTIRQTLPVTLTTPYDICFKTIIWDAVNTKMSVLKIKISKKQLPNVSLFETNSGQPPMVVVSITASWLVVLNEFTTAGPHSNAVTAHSTEHRNDFISNCRYISTQKALYTYKPHLTTFGNLSRNTAQCTFVAHSASVSNSRKTRRRSPD